MAEMLVASKGLPVGSKGRFASGWWGMVALIATESALFAYLFFSYYYLASHAVGAWPPQGDPDLTIALPGTLILIAGSVVMWWGKRGIERGKPLRLKIGLIAAILLGISFVILEILEWKGQAIHFVELAVQFAVLHHHWISHATCCHRPICAIRVNGLGHARLLR